MSFATPTSIPFEVTLACLGAERAFGRRNAAGCLGLADWADPERYGRSTGTSLISRSGVVRSRWAAISIADIKSGRSSGDGMLQ